MLNNYYYDNLSIQEQNSYNNIYYALMRGEKQCTVFSDVQAASNILKAVKADHPELINFPGVFCSYRALGGSTVFSFPYIETDQARYKNKLDAIVSKLDRKISSKASDYYVCKTIYDELASSVEYDYGALNSFIRISNLKSSNDAKADAEMIRFFQSESLNFTAYGVFVNSKGVCEGIAKAYKILCNKFGVQCAFVESESIDSKTPHAINVVEADGVRAYVDVTDGMKSKDFQMVRYDLFLASSNVISKVQTVSRDFGCNDESVNFFNKNKLTFSSADELRRYLSAYAYSSTNGQIRCRYTGKHLNDKKLEEMFGYVVNRHCGQGWHMRHGIVKNGFCSGYITKDSEC